MPLTPQCEDEALSLLTDLIRVDTSNPPGNESACAELLARALAQDGYEPILLGAEPGRANLVVRRRGDGTGGGPLLLTGHTDVVPAEPSEWKHPPFAGRIEDGWLFGRGAVDMKNHLAACATVMRLLARDEVKLKRDVIFAAVADEERGCAGARFLVEEHPDLVRADWAIGEVGGFTLPVGKKRLYPIQVATRGVSWFRMRAKGAPGHGSMPREDSSVLKLARAVMRLGNKPLPVHPTPASLSMLSALAKARGGLAPLGVRLLARPALHDYLLESFVPDPYVRRSLGAILRNTATPTVLKAGEITNVIPSVAEAHLDGRTLPGQTTQDLLREIQEVVDDEQITFELLQELPPVEAPIDSPLYEQLSRSIKAMDPQGEAMPFVTAGATDASIFCKLGMRFYGFEPVVLPERPKVAFGELFHARDERIPVDGFKKGLHALWNAVVGFCGQR